MSTSRVNTSLSAPGQEQAPGFPRRVVTGENADGKSVIVTDAVISDWIQRPTGLSVTEIWRADSLPTHIKDNSSAQEGVIPSLATSGLAVRLAVFPPDKDVDAEKLEAYDASIRDLYGDQGESHSTSEIAGMHRTDTVDILTVVEGEIWVLLDEGETVLRKGDCLIQRGTRHAWRNRSDSPCTLVSVALPATRG